MSEADPCHIPMLPIPPDAVRIEPLPVEPLPVRALPVLPIPPTTSYQSHGAPSRIYGRPGIISAIGVSSIVVASICLVGGFVMVMVNLAVSSVARFAPMPTPAAATPVAAPGPPELLGPNGTAAADRAVIVSGLDRVQPLTEAQKQQLDELLAREGKSVPPLSGPGITLEQVAANVTRSGHLAAGESSGGSDTTSYFVLGNGRLELTDGRAVFFPTNGQPSIRANAVNVPPSSSSQLQPDQIRSVLRAIDRMNGVNIKSAQAKALVQTLQGPGQQLISPTTDGSDPALEIKTAATDPDDGSLTLESHHGNTDSSITLDPAGNITTTSTTRFSTFSTGGTMTGPRPPNFNRAAAEWMSFITAIQLALAVYLLVCGIFMLRSGSLLGRRMHWTYIGIKLPVAIAGCGVAWWLWNGFFTAAAANPTSGVTAATAFWFVAPAAIGMIYPIVLLLVLATSRGVKACFSAARYAA